MIRSFGGIVAGLCLCIAASSCEGADLLISVSNPSRAVRRSETVEVRLADITAKDPSLKARNLIVVDQAAGTELGTQVTDSLLLFQSDFGPGEAKTFVVKPEEGAHKESASKDDGYFARPREDYAWENDRIAFRMYGPALAAEVSNGIDVWTKRVRSLIVRKWYEADEKEGKGTYYHTDRGEGADFFSVGKTLGAGGNGIWYKDSLYQPGVFTSYKTLANGPIRTSFELTYAKWNVRGKTFTETERISLDAGRNLNKIEVSFTGLDPTDSLLIACGLVKRKGVALQAGAGNGALALWGPTNDDPVNGSLGTGILLKPAAVAGKHDDSVQVILLGRMEIGKPFVYWAGAGWTRSGDFASAASWASYLAEFSASISEPLQVSVISGRR
jgi:pectinesterase